MKKKEEEKPGRCAYDWKPGSNWLLVCQVCASRHTTVRILNLGHDLLEELFRRGMLTGAALEEVQREFSGSGMKDDEKWLDGF